MVDPRSCRRLRGGSARDCICKLPPHNRDNGGGWAQCPPEARGLLVPVEPERPPPVLNGHAAAEREAVWCPSGFAVGASVIERPNYAGEMCDSCGSFNTRRTGTCIQCLDCYSTGGCG